MAPQWLQTELFEKISNFKNVNVLYTILKHVVWRFRICNYFREIFKFREICFRSYFREIWIFRESNYIFEISRPRSLKWFIICSEF